LSAKSWTKKKTIVETLGTGKSTFLRKIQLVFFSVNCCNTQNVTIKQKDQPKKKSYQITTIN